MSFKDIVIPVLDVGEDEAALKASEIVADMADGHLTAVLIQMEPDPMVAAEAPVFGALWDQISQQLADNARTAANALARRPWSRRITMRELRTRPAEMAKDLAALARYSDLIVMRRPIHDIERAARTELFEAVLFGSGRPVLLVPPDWRFDIGQRILVAWNGKREAARALADAAPFLGAASRVMVATVVQGQDGDDAASICAEHLGKHGVKAEAKVLAAKPGAETEALVKAARDMDADLIVMGGYGHARAAEFVFGGMTRSLSQTAAVPILMSH